MILATIVISTCDKSGRYNSSMFQGGACAFRKRRLHFSVRSRLSVFFVLFMAFADFNRMIMSVGVGSVA